MSVPLMHPRTVRSACSNGTIVGSAVNDERRDRDPLRRRKRSGEPHVPNATAHASLRRGEGPKEPGNELTLGGIECGREEGLGDIDTRAQREPRDAEPRIRHWTADRRQHHDARHALWVTPGEMQRRHPAS